jgi:lysophospholipase L1-like esterase
MSATQVESSDPDLLSTASAASMLTGARWKRLVILGDSLAEDISEPVPGYRDLSWTDRISEALGAVQSEFVAFNLGRRNLLVPEVRMTQLTPALELRPDLAFVVAGVSDLSQREFNSHLVRSELSVMISALRAAGADVLTVGWPERYCKLATLTAEVSGKFGGIFCALSADPLRLDARGHAIAASEVIRELSASMR